MCSMPKKIIQPPYACRRRAPRLHTGVLGPARRTLRAARGLCSLAALALAVAAMPQVRAQDAPDKRAATNADLLAWKNIQGAMLTPDGKWMTYLLSPVAGKAAKGTNGPVVVLRHFATGREWRFSAGDSGGSLQMSKDGRWLAFLRIEASPATSSAVLVNIATAQESVIQNVSDFAFCGPAADWAVFKAGPLPNAPSSMVTLRHLDTAKDIQLADVHEYAFDAQGKRLAWITEADDGQDNVIQVRDLASGRTVPVDSSPGDHYQGLAWSDSGSAIAAWRTPPRESNRPPVLIAASKLDAVIPDKVVLEASTWKGFPKGDELNVDEVINWQSDDRGLFVSVRRGKKKVKDETALNLQIWHWRAGINPNPLNRTYVPSYSAYISLADRRFVPLGEATNPRADPNFVVKPRPEGRYTLGYDSHGVEGTRQSDLTGWYPRDYYVVDQNTGARTPLASGLRMDIWSGRNISPVLSPDGQTIVYFKDGDYFIHDAVSRKSWNATSALGPFYDSNLRYIDKTVDIQSGPKVVGWSSDGQFVLISDHWDIWALPRKSTTGAKPFKLTPNGRAEQIAYTYVDPEVGELAWQPFGSIAGLREAEAQRLIDLAKPLFFRGVAWTTQQSGYFRRLPAVRGNRVSFQKLVWGNAEFGNLIKSKNANTYIYTRQTAFEFPDYILTEDDFVSSKMVTNANPMQSTLKKYKSRLVNYSNSRGEKRRAVLYYPENYDAGRSYPTIVSVYEDQFPTIYNRYIRPFDYGELAQLERGYAILKPEIVPRANETGASALDDTLSAIDAAAALGVVDKSRLGIWGSSYGGFEVAFIITQTNIFKAAAAYDIISDLRMNSMEAYLGMFTNLGMSVITQQYITKPWWEAPEIYEKSSPLTFAQNVQTPLLMKQNSADARTPFVHGVAFFNTLRAMGKPVVMLEYVGKGHGGGGKDVAKRQEEFFDHFLLGKPAPLWWTDPTPPSEPSETK